jgi:cutinase
VHARSLALVDTRHATAGPCPGVEVVSARGTDEPPGPGSIGQTFIDSLRPEIPGRSLEVYGVRYPATGDFNRSESAGADDARAHVQSTVANCPDTRIVLSGYSQGAASSLPSARFTGPKTIDLCVPDDPICSEGTNEAAHHLYDQNGMTTQAATFVAQKL